MSIKKYFPLLALPLILLAGSCRKKAEKINPAFQSYIQAFTAGPVSVKGPVRIRLTEEFVNDDQLNLPVEADFFSFKPAIRGKAYWIDRQTLEFRPDETLPAGKRYTALFHLSKLMAVPDSLSEFVFSFRTIRQDMSFIIENHKPYNNDDLRREKLYGKVLTADVTDDASIPKILEATQDGRKLPVTWIHEAKKKTHFFQVDSIRRTNEASELILKWDGDAIDADVSGKEKIIIEPLSVFKKSAVKVVQADEKYILVQFTDPLKEDQDLEGMISLGQKITFRTSIEDNELKIYPSEIKSKTVNLTINAAIKNREGTALGSGISEKLTWEDTRPAIRFVGQGAIMPVSRQLILPFEAVNLKAVDLKIIKIYENNVMQFLQVNDLNGQTELARVGQIVLKKTIPLKEVTDYTRWNRYSLDLSELIRPEEGAIYCIRLNFRKSYSTWMCNTGNEDDFNMVVNQDKNVEENRSWYYYSSYEDDFSYEDEGYDWEERENPCKSSYYTGRSVSTNLLVSNFGIIAKQGNQGKLMVVITDLITAKPVSGVKLDVYNFQQQKIISGITDGEGTAIVEAETKPFIVVARKEKQAGYLRLMDGKSLSLSMFDAGGEQVQKGLKGFLYGDRGVWRPGDSLFLTFILEDKNQTIPPNHPVSFTLSNPSGQIVNHINRTGSLNGFYSFATATTADAPTGNWTARVKVGDAEFRKTLKIETVKPNRLRIGLDFGSDRLIRGKEPVVKLSSSWLTGAVADRLKATVNLTLTSSKTSFKKYPGYTFENPSASFTSEKSTVFEGKLNEEGKASFTPKIKMTSAAPGILNATFETTVFEQGGDFSIDKYTLPYYPFSSFAGIAIQNNEKNKRFLYTGRNYKVNLVDVDQDGVPVKSNRLTVELLKLDWRWWWDESGDGGNAGFISTAYSQVTDKEVVEVRNGEASFNFEKEDDDWGRYFIRVTDTKSGHVAGMEVFVDWYGYSHSTNGEKQAATMLSFTTDKEKYKVGEKVKFAFPSPENGRALLTLENGSQVLRSYWINTTKGTTTYSLDVTPDMAPNCYAGITLIQPHAQTVNDAPIRLYGVVPILVEDPSSFLHPVISMKEVMRPEESVSITVKEQNGMPMTYTLAVVDEGLLDLTRFKTPDPHAVFYAREALGVKTWDIYDQVLGAWSGELQRILSIGGDQEAVNKGALKANRFKPVVKFFGPYNLPRRGSKTHTFKMPQYVGSVRVMVVAGNNGAYGSSEKTVPVRKPLMVLGTLPRVLSPGETVVIPVTVFAMEKNISDVKVSIIPNEFFTVSGNSSGSVRFSKTGEKIIYFRLRVKEAVGIGKVNIAAVSGNEKAVTDIELDVRNPGVPVTETLETTLGPGATWNGNYLLPGMAGTNKGAVEVYAVPPMNLEKRLGYLINYPHGCAEQVTSGAFPQLYLQDLIDLSDVRKKEIEKNIRAASQKIRSQQIANGGITLWPGSDYADDWATSYAGHFLLEAQKKGYDIPAGFLSSWKNFQKQKAISWKYNESWYNNDLMQAYRLFTLALAGSPELGSMNVLREQKNLSLQARWRLAAAYVLAGKPEAALKLTSNVQKTVAPYREMDISYGSDIRDESMIIETLLLMNRKNDAAALVKKVASELAKEGWMSTQTTAFALMAVSKFTGESGGSGIDVSVKVEGAKDQKFKSEKSVVSMPLDVRNKTGKGTVTIKNSGKNMLTIRVITSGIPSKGDTSSSSSGLKMEIRYLSSSGQVINPGSLAKGTSFSAEVSITNPGLRGEYRQMALTQVVPSGWEIINARMSEYAAAGTNASDFNYQDVRDDRILTYFEIPPSRTKVFRVMLIASYEGRFYLPPLYCEAMYDNSIHAKIPGRWVEVTGEGK